MTDDTHRKAVDAAVRARLLANENLDHEQIDNMMRVAYETLKLSVIPGKSGMHIKPDHAARFVSSMLERPGFRRDKGGTKSAPTDGFNEAEFRALPPAERLRLINRGLSRDSDGKIRPAVSVKRDSDGRYTTS